MVSGLIIHFMQRLSEVLNTKIESKDLVKSEIVQAIFRTQARIGKSVSIAFFTIIMRNYWMDTIHLKKVLIVY